MLRDQALDVHGVAASCHWVVGQPVFRRCFVVAAVHMISCRLITVLCVFYYCAALATRCAGVPLTVLQNDFISVGISTAAGGAIALLTDNNVPGRNLINVHDFGRYVQQSYYAGPDPYREARWNEQPWAWNPISAGDVYGNAGHILDVQIVGNDTIVVSSIPKQWALNNVSCNCTFHSRLTLDGTGFLVRNRLRTYREDTRVYAPLNQELPAVYVIGQLYELWTYNGKSPWRSDMNLTKVAYPRPGPPWASFAATEGWAAWTQGDAQRYGVGVFHPGATQFLGGFHGTPGSGGEFDDDTGYVAPTQKWRIAANDTVEWCYYVSVGYLSTIREYFRQRRHRRCA